ncbi:MAG: EAL domain-containing protein [Gammaproteobacteria bacterium]
MKNFLDVMGDPQRLAALRRSELLDTPAEAAFDRLTKLAFDILEVEIAVVNLVDDHRQFYKSQIGIPGPERSYPLNHGFCQYVVASGEILSIEDTLQKPLFSDNPVTTTWGVRAYLGIPLITADQYVLGTLSVFDKQPRAWTPKQIDMLRNIAAAVITEIELCLKAVEARAANTKAATAEEQFHGLIQQATVGIAQIDLDGRFLLANPCYCEMVGRSLHDLLQLSMQDIMPPEYLPANLLLFGRVLTGQPVFTVEKRYIRPDGSDVWVNISIASVADSKGKPYSMVAVMQDIGVRKQAETLQAGQNRVLEMLTLGASLNEVLDYLCRFSQRQLPGSVTSILLLDKQGKTLHLGAGPDLPPAYKEAIDDFAIDPDVGPRGITAHLEQQDLTGDKILNPCWADLRNLARRYQPHACWSKPIFSVTGQTLGIFAVYYEQPRAPTPVDIERIDGCLHLAAIAIERKQAEEALRQSEAFNKRVIESIHDCIAILSLDGTLLYISPQGLHLLEFSDPASCLGRSWIDFWNGQDKESAQAALAEAGAGSAGNFQGFFVTERGTPTWWDVTITPIANPEGNIERLLVVSRDITERKLAQDALKQFGEQLQVITNIVPALISYVDKDGYYRFNNLAHESWFGRPLAEITDRRVSEVLGEAVWATIQPYVVAALTGQIVSSQIKLPDNYGGERWVSATYTPHVNSEGDIYGTVVLMNDITEQLNMKDALRESGERFRFLAESMPQKIFTARPNGNVDYVNPQWISFTGLPVDEIKDSCWARLVHSEDLEETLRSWQHSIDTGEAFQLEHRFRMANDMYRWHLTCAQAMRDENGKIIMWVGSNTDIEDYKRAEDTLRYSASHDALTGCPNKALFLGLLERSISRAQRRSDYSFAILFLDLDGFKNVNDRLGHMLGDQLLIAVAERLSATLRDGDTLARFGGDEFTILIEDIRDISEAIDVAERIKHTLGRPFMLQGQEVFTGISIGITQSTPGVTKAEDIVREADIAMYRAKALGRSGYEIFSREAHANNSRLGELEGDLRRAVEHHELLFHYQPIVSLESRTITGVEALARWQHPQHGLIPPSEFIPLAEETGLICRISEHLLHIACAQLKSWQAAGYPQLTVAVNCSALQFEDKNLAGLVKGVLDKTGLEPQSLVLEVSETLVMKYQDTSMAVLKELNALGVKIAIGDFGTGYSSLFYLKRFPIDTIKIDRSFIKDMTGHKGDAEICAAIIAMSHKLGLGVIAEGVETEEQLTMLRNLNCNMIQGYLFSKPLEAHALTDLLAQKELLMRVLRPKNEIGFQ